MKKRTPCNYLQKESQQSCMEEQKKRGLDDMTKKKQGNILSDKCKQSLYSYMTTMKKL